jgi:hypothetical protein
MKSALGASELHVSDDGLRLQAGCCESLARKVAGNRTPTGTGSSWLGSAAAVNAANADVATAGIRCTFRMQATATKLTAAAHGYTENEAESAAQFPAIDTPEAY